LGALFLVLGILWAALWLLRRSGRFAGMPRVGSLPRDGLYLEGHLSLGPRKGLTVVRFLNKRLLLGITEHQITLLTETDPDDAPPPPSAAAAFQSCLDDAAGSPGPAVCGSREPDKPGAR
jgi:flagellar protein FliO/FliZ